MAPFDARLASYIGKRSTELKQFNVQTQHGPEKASALSPAVIIAHSWALKVLATPTLASVSSQNFALHLAIAVMIRSS